MRNRKRGGRGRPRCMRNVSKIPEADYFKPGGIPLVDLEAARVSIEELEAIRLVDFSGLEHEEVAQKMNVSRKTLWMDLKSARKKVDDALINGKAIEIKGRDFVVKT